MFICLEGSDGVGKSTQAKLLLDRLIANNVPAELVVDPGTTELGKKIRALLLESKQPIEPATQLLLFSAARAELVPHICQLLAAGKVVISDRWLLSTLVYQTVVNNMPPAFIWQIFNETVGLHPDYYFVLDMPAETAIARVGTPTDRYEEQLKDTALELRSAYLQHMNNYRQYVKGTSKVVLHLMAADKAPDKLHDLIYGLLPTSVSDSPII